MKFFFIFSGVHHQAIPVEILFRPRQIIPRPTKAEILGIKASDSAIEPKYVPLQQSASGSQKVSSLTNDEFLSILTAVQQQNANGAIVKTGIKPKENRTQPNRTPLPGGVQSLFKEAQGAANKPHREEKKASVHKDKRNILTELFPSPPPPPLSDFSSARHLTSVTYVKSSSSDERAKTVDNEVNTQRDFRVYFNC